MDYVVFNPKTRRFVLCKNLVGFPDDCLTCPLRNDNNVLDYLYSISRFGFDVEVGVKKEETSLKSVLTIKDSGNDLEMSGEGIFIWQALNDLVSKL